MDSNETAQQLLNRDPFHQMKRNKDKKKENTGYRGFADTRIRAEHNKQWANSHSSWDRNGRRGDYARNPVPGISRVFRVVRDNRMNQKASMVIMPESLQNSAKDNNQVISNVPEKSSSGNVIGENHSPARNSDGHMVCQDQNRRCDTGQGHARDAKSNGSDRLSVPVEKQVTVPNSTAMVPREDNNSQAHSATLPSANSVIGVYSASSDPVHVPSSRSAGTVGAIRREVGVVGVWRQSSDRTATHTSISSNSFLIPLLGKDVSSSIESFGHSATSSKSSNPNPSPKSEPIIPCMSVSRSFPASQYNVKLHQQDVGHHKATQPNMEWRPKSSQKPNANSPVATTITFVASSCADNSTRSSQVQVAGLSEKLSQVNVSKNEHVIIPHHLRVPESERIGLTFGSFGAGYDSTKGFSSAFQAFRNAEESSLEPSLSISALVPVGSNQDASTTDQSDLVDSQARTSRSDSPASAAELEQPLPVNNESSSPRDIKSYADIGLLQSHSPSYSSPELQQLQNAPSLLSFPAYDPQTKYDVPFFKTIVEDNARGQGFSAAFEGLSSHAASCSPFSSVPMMQQQQQQQQQPLTQLYPQVHFSHYPNFVPYRQVFSPVYVPPMAMPNYPNNPSYPHPSNGSNYLLMPGGSSHLTAGSMKYTASQYKPVHAGSPTAGYGNYINPGGYAIGTPGTTTGLEDVARIKYKDSNLYVPHQQAETSDIWVQTPRELASLQATPYYNLSGQAAAAAAPPQPAYLPTAHTSHPSFNTVAAQSSHIQYSGLYHPSQPGSTAGPTHHLVHQQAPLGLGGNARVGVAAAGAQVGAYQQPQLGHLGWTANF